MFVARRIFQHVIKGTTPASDVACSQHRWLSTTPSAHRGRDNATATREQDSTVATIVDHEKLKKRKAWDAELKRSLQYPDYFNVLNLFNVEDLFNARVHLGHRDGTLNSHMAKYVLGSRLSHLIIDLDKTVAHLRRALNFLAHMAFRDSCILFVCTNFQHQHMVEDVAAKCGEYAHTRMWNAGTLPNNVVHYSGLIRLPDVIILLSTHNHLLDNHLAVKDSAKMLIPTIGVVDTNTDPRLISYPIPGNDDTHQSVELFCELFAKTITIGKNKRKEFLKSL